MSDSVREKFIRLTSRRFDEPAPSNIVPLRERINSLSQQAEISQANLEKFRLSDRMRKQESLAVESSPNQGKILQPRRSISSGEKLDLLTRRRFDMPGPACTIPLKERINIFTQQAERTRENLEKNPFSDTYKARRHDPSQADYGRPDKGSLTERRGVAAGNDVSREILELCQVINDCGCRRPDGSVIIKFGQLFNIYTKISDKVVGMLLRARRHGLVEFEGEMLYQRRDEEIVITLLKSLEEIKASVCESNDPARCLNTN